MDFCASWIVFTIAAFLVSGCGGGSSSGNNMPTGSTSTTDMGTLSTVGDTYAYALKNAASGMVLGISGQNQTAGTYVVQEPSTTSPDDINWHFIPLDNDEYNIENMLTHQLLGILNASTAAGTQVLQYSDNGTNDHLWEFFLLTDGNYLIKNVNSGYYLEVAGSSTSAVIDQGQRSSTSAGCTCQEWMLTSTNTAAYPAPAAVNVTYSAPDSAVIGIHDPSMLKAGSNYYLYSTHGTIHAHQSVDRTSFSDAGYALTAPPSWTNAYTASSGDLWAPDASYHAASSSPYWLYYAASTFGNSNSAIGLAYSASGAPGTFADSGAAIYTSADCVGANAIDPASVIDASGNTWLVFGSWSSGIQIVPVNNATGIPIAGQPCKQLAYHPSGTGIEGAYIYPHGPYYYLFASIDTCCNGVSSTYRIIVGRSTSVNGPYTDRGGVALTSGGGTILLSAHGNINGPGSETVLNDTDGDILVYHYYDGSNNGNPALGINLLGWTADGWPFVQ